MENTIKQEIEWTHINHHQPQKGVLVHIGGENCIHVAELVDRKGLLRWELFADQGDADFDKYPYWCYPEAPVRSDNSRQGYIVVKNGKITRK